MSKVELINRRTWKNPLERRYYRAIHGYIDQGEEKAFDLALAAASGARVLDIGVGAGRTAELLAPRSRSYVGIDYTPEMIDLSHRLLPELRFEVMDARNLAAFEDASFDLAVFSYNGIDSVEGEGRLQVLNEVARVLRPGGCFVFSTFNRGWNGFGTSRFSPRVTWTADPVRLAYRLTMRSMGWFRQHWYRRYEIQGEHNVILHHAHHFGIMVYATTPAQLRRQLTDAGFEARFDLFSPQGEMLDFGGETCDVEYFHVLAVRGHDQESENRHSSAPRKLDLLSSADPI